MVFTEKGELQSASRSSREQFLRDWQWQPAEDLCIDVYTPGSSGKYEWPKDIKPKKGELPKSLADDARAYISVICRVYPFQMRHFLGESMWMRYCDVWADTGDHVKAMRSI